MFNEFDVLTYSAVKECSRMAINFCVHICHLLVLQVFVGTFLLPRRNFYLQITFKIFSLYFYCNLLDLIFVFLFFFLWYAFIFIILLLIYSYLACFILRMQYDILKLCYLYKFYSKLLPLLLLDKIFHLYLTSVFLKFTYIFVFTALQRHRN